ncbi:hypothetical protein QKU48_gp0205 [Fadolivirus algeromassiliense]|jgi:hypothetical protein|uniref:Sulfotransferase family protein n=1 Tax=Fadolivirus FV1/VV64 TaxID=3070911 RepID=A0A7D3QTW7_9VIRU|nr:hypothetical protein QKU48_gp0205 [Fadolivirus algeromassiliense]QKF93663.1 hypothetical protein Fadolivirus_1_205 [Fadolivirus FV1/VV64]
MEQKDFIFLHVPHTAGRVLKNYLWTNRKKVINVHNDKDMKLIKNKALQKYFILRNPIERIIGECVHYSTNLKNIGIVNYLSMDDILIRNPYFNPENISEYIKLEATKNLYCKFLLNRDNFWEPITANDFDKITKILEKGEFIYDKYTNPMDYEKLSQLIGIDRKEINKVTMEITTKSQIINKTNINIKKELLNNTNLIKEIELMNEYDIKLFTLLI